MKCDKCGEREPNHSDREYLRWMIRHRILDDEKHGGDWVETDIFPIEWDKEVLTAVLDIAMERKK